MPFGAIDVQITGKQIPQRFPVLLFGSGSLAGLPDTVGEDAACVLGLTHAEEHADHIAGCATDQLSRDSARDIGKLAVLDAPFFRFVLHNRTPLIFRFPLVIILQNAGKSNAPGAEGN